MGRDLLLPGLQGKAGRRQAQMPIPCSARSRAKRGAAKADRMQSLQVRSAPRLVPQRRKGAGRMKPSLWFCFNVVCWSLIAGAIGCLALIVLAGR